MAFRRRKLRNPDGTFRTEPVRCYFCKEKKATTSIHGGSATLMNWGGKCCCDECFPSVRAQVAVHASRQSNHMTEADYQTWGRL